MQKYRVEVDCVGGTYWYKFGTDELHRENGPAVICSNGIKIWLQNGLRHRLNGPAMEYTDGSKVWYKNGLRHRIDGPAVEYTDGFKEYWLDGRKYSAETWQKKVNELQNPACNDKVVEIEGKKYKLMEVK